MCPENNIGLAPSIYPLSPNRWTDLVTLFGERGACGGCWCMWWRLSRAQWVKQKGLANQRAFRDVVKSGPPPGLLAYADGEAVGWCALAPRADYPRLANSRILKPVDDEPVWSISCFFVARGFRRKGVTLALLKAAAAYARSQGASLLEGYPCEPKAGYPDVFYYTGLASTFRKVGFREVARRSPSRPIMRLAL
jgi:GNAT superfamily N-acetyltransferase